jgi:dinuclear metal center YbgI/SA1388 family protein
MRPGSACSRRRASAGNVYVVGSNANQNNVAPTVTLGSVVIDLPRAFLRVAREVKQGTFKPEVVRLGLDTRVVTLVLNPAVEGRIPADVRAQLDSAERAIEAGTLKPLPDTERYGGRSAAGGSGIKVSEAAPAGQSIAGRRSRDACLGRRRAAASLDAVVGHLDAVLRTREVPDYGGALNGLQVANSGRVDRVAVAVDFSRAAVEQAVAAGAGLLVVHHGMFWGGAQAVVGPAYERMRLLMAHDVAVYASHLPLDLHPTLGNNVLLANELGLSPTGGFGRFKTVDVGVRGEAEGLETAALAERAAAFCGRWGHALRHTPMAPGRPTRRWGLCTGAGASSETLAEAGALGLDTLVVGEGPHHTAVEAAERGIVVLYAGHYATETLGVRALGDELGRTFGLEWSFVGEPTGL